jgi:hypothetical protein
MKTIERLTHRASLGSAMVIYAALAVLAFSPASARRFGLIFVAVHVDGVPPPTAVAATTFNQAMHVSAPQGPRSVFQAPCARPTSLSQANWRSVDPRGIRSI